MEDESMRSGEGVEVGVGETLDEVTSDDQLLDSLSVMTAYIVRLRTVSADHRWGLGNITLCPRWCWESRSCLFIAAGRSWRDGIRMLRGPATPLSLYI